MVDWRAVRREFPALRDWTFLNTATIGQMPRRAVDRIAQHFAHRDEEACTDLFDWFDDTDDIRKSIARLINAQASDIAYIPNAAFALSLLMGGYPWHEGDQFLTVTNEFPNQYYYGQLLASRGVEFLEVPYDELEQAITGRTRIIAVSEVSYSTGYRLPVERISELAHRYRICLYLDGTQSTGALKIDMAAIQPDMFAVDGYKWLLSPNGIGFMYVSRQLREQLQPNVIGWRSDHRWRQPANLHHGVPEFSPAAERYEGGMLGFAPIYAMGEAVNMFLQIGPEDIEQRVLELARKLADSLDRLGLRQTIESPLPSAILTAAIEDRDATDMVAALRDERVVIAARRGNIRMSVHFYNDEDDIARFEECLRAALARS
jgi:selenocysteine lyase/cysteine desulfurase